MRQKLITFKSPLRPALTTISGNTFVVGGDAPWLEVPAGTTLGQIKWVGPRRKKVVRPKEFVREVPSSRGNKTYTVRIRTDGVKSCTCSGSMYRRRCRHVDEYKKELGIK